MGDQGPAACGQGTCPACSVDQPCRLQPLRARVYTRPPFPAPPCRPPFFPRSLPCTHPSVLPASWSIFTLRGKQNHSITKTPTAEPQGLSKACGPLPSSEHAGLLPAPPVHKPPHVSAPPFLCPPPPYFLFQESCSQKHPCYVVLSRNLQGFHVPQVSVVEGGRFAPLPLHLSS